MATKKQIKYFTIFDHKKEEAYLSDMHGRGWRFVRVSGLGTYHFESCEPEAVVYQLDYDPRSRESREEYLQLFSDCGWEYIQEYVGYSYFRKPRAQMKGEENIFNDAESSDAMMERVYKGRLLPLLVLFCAVLVPQFILNIVNARYAFATFFGGILAVYIAVFIGFAISRHRSKRR